jgi:hypothetical protein
MKRSATALKYEDVTEPARRPSPAAGDMNELSARERDRQTVARLTGAAWRNASSREPDEEQADVAVRELRGIAAGRGDLLAEVAGLLIGYYRQTAEERKARAAAYYCIAAGAGLELIPRWIEVGCSRAAAARLIPPAVPGAAKVQAWPEAV